MGKKWRKPITVRFDNLADLECRNCFQVRPQSSFRPLKYYVPVRRGIMVKMYHPFCADCRASKCEKWSHSPVYNAQVQEFLMGLRSRQQAAANNRSIAFLLTDDDVVEMFIAQCGKCALSGTPMMTETGTNGARNWWAASIDRIDSKGNYTSDNVQLVCAGVNLVKQEMPQNTFIEFCRKVVEHQVRRLDELEQAIAG